MSDTEPTTPGGKSKEELLEDTKEHFGEKKAKQNEALEAIAQGGEFESYDTVTLGELELEVKAWIPGNVEETIERAQNMAERGDEMELQRSMETMITALDSMTVNETYGRDFWKQFHQEYGQIGMITATETILEPATEEMEELQEGVESFRKDGSGNIVGARNRTNE